MEFKDYYKIMGLSPEASQEEIKRAYRKLARKFHPDVSRELDAETKFKELGEAYEVLKDTTKRARYDSLRQQGWQGGESFKAPPNWQRESTQNEQAGVFSDFFESLFGYQPKTSRGRGHGFYQAPTRGEDISYRLEVSLEDSFTGATHQIEVPTTQITDEGQIIHKTRIIKVKVPQGIINGQQIRLRGQGGQGYQNAPNGDLYLEIHLRATMPYHVEGKNITLFLPISPWEAALGSKVKAPSLGGPIEVTIPPNSQTGTKLRLKGRGLPGHPPGDQYVVLQVMTPPATTDKAKELYQQMANNIVFNPRENLGV